MFLFFIINTADTSKDNISAKTTDNHIPSISKNIGNINIIAIWNTKVLKKEIIADINPLFNAVKKLEENIEKPLNKNDIENSLIA